MMSRSLFPTLFVIASAALGGCTTLSARQPLFSTTDQIGPAPLREGIWIAVSDQCPASNAHRRWGRFPKDCSPMEIRRDADGGWVVTSRPDLMSSPPDRDTPDGPMNVVLVPAIELPSADQYAPLYVGQYAPNAEIPAVLFFALAPVDTMPATTLIYVDLSCIPILRDGPVDGIDVTYAEPNGDANAAPGQNIQDCVATTQASVREAARRALVDRFPTIVASEDRLVFVRER